ncbi:SusC/RagA family TonB-linked outer membrane protein [Daejeonella sp.]|uniref:SusC/RagA family TonB-linked outer membrane protein n=1 Tax=Daejeonella sp. TaxID=2805397 RepID=UPI0025C2EBB2|nr:SusC/RagA family TonB-linked outer membrane protein [Daejeonella sp.]
MKRKLMLFLMVVLYSVAVSAQDRKTVNGVVKDSAGLPLPGVTVQEVGTKNGVSTSANGEYKMTVSSKSVLKFSLIGFVAKNVTVGAQSTINVTLSDDAAALDEVVVTSLGISRQQKSLGYAVSTIKATELTKVGSPSFATALYGKAPGVRIGATPGGATSAVNITIRGINSITGKNQPLIVMDGVPIRNEEVNNGDYWGDQRIRGNGLLDINPEDIENVSILKGASAAALYGSEAVNGVVLITTKKGNAAGKGFSVDFNANYNVDNVAYLPNYQNVRGAGAPLNISNGGQDAEGFVYVDMDGNGSKETRSILGYSINFGPKFDGKPTVGWDGIIRPYEAQIDNYAGLYQSANNSNINLAVSNSTENSNIRFSLTRQDNQGVSLGAENSKNSANLNTSFKLGKSFSTDITVNYVNQRTGNRPYSIDRLMNNFTGMMGRFDNADWYLNKYKTSKGYRYVTGASGQSLTPNENILYNGFKGDIADYVWRVKEHNDTELSDRVISSLTNNWSITNNLKLRTRFATDFTSMKGEIKQTTERPLAFGNSGYFGMNSSQNKILYGDALLTYTRNVTKDIEMNVMGGYTATKENGSRLSRGTADGLSTENLFDLAASVGTPGSGSSRYSIVKDALLGVVNANYKNYLYLEGTVRRDRTSTMNPNSNSFVYPSVNSSFIFSDAFKMPSIMSYGKVRASWGIVGNYPDAYRANVAYNQSSLGNQGGSQSVLITNLPSDIGNDGIRPEIKNEIELGLETKFFKDRFGVELSYYNAQVKDQILPLTIPPTSGATSILTNIGTLRNTGFELSITGTPIKSRNFRWDAGINLASNQNKVEKLANGSSELLHADYDGSAAQLRSVVGQPMGDFYAHPVATHSNGQPIVDPNGLYKVDANKWTKIGNAMPKAIGGFFNSFNYKGITLDAMVDFRFGGYVMPTGLNWMISRGLLEESTQFMDKESGGLSYYQTSAGKRILTSAAQGPAGETVYHDGMLQPGVKLDGSQSDYIASSADYFWTVYNWGGPQYSPNTRYELYIQKNSYIKFREVSLGFNIPAKITSKLGVKKIQASVFGRNLFYFYRTLKNMDAEQTTAGSRWAQTLTNIGTNPSTRSFGAMLRANF